MVIRWRIIGELTDKTVLGTDGLSNKEPQRKSRAILVNNEGQYAVIFETKSNLYMLPGGGIEVKEDEITAIKREVLEETGCKCDTIEPLGIVLENRYHADNTRLSYYFVIHTNDHNRIPNLTSEEIAFETVLKWCSLEEMLHLIRDVEHDTKQKKFIQARDLVALNVYAKNLHK